MRWAMRVDISSELIAALLAQAAAEHPQECCGILLGQMISGPEISGPEILGPGRGVRITAIQPARNIHHTPHTHFEIDPQALIDTYRGARRGQADVLGYYHSHPVGQAQPSATDREMAAGDGRVWAIIAAGKLQFWKDGQDRFDPLPYVVEDA